MSLPLSGVRVLEVSSWMFVPSCGAILADWGAEIIKVEHPETGDPQRGLITSGLLPGGGGVNFMMEQPNRNKQSVGIDLTTPDGHELLMKLAESADVFLTSYLPSVRRKLKIDVDDVRARNPKIVYARGSGQGTKGPDADKGGYDGAVFWARGGVGSLLPENSNGYPMGQPGPAFGDVMAGLATAGGICAALYSRESGGEPATVDVSLLATAMWQASPLIIASKLFGFSKIPQGDRRQSPNPGVGTYKTSDDRFISLILLQSDKFWEDLVTRLERPDMVTDERFVDSTARAANAGECIDALDEAFGAHPLSHWREVLEDFSGVWAPFQTLDELYEDEQVIANSYLPAMKTEAGDEVQLVASPVQFDEAAITVTRAPEHGEQTEQVMLDLGYDWEQIAAMKESGAII